MRGSHSAGIPSLPQAYAMGPFYTKRLALLRPAAFETVLSGDHSDLLGRGSAGSHALSFRIEPHRHAWDEYHADSCTPRRIKPDKPELWVCSRQHVFCSRQHVVWHYFFTDVLDL